MCPNLKTALFAFFSGRKRTHFMQTSFTKFHIERILNFAVTKKAKKDFKAQIKPLTEAFLFPI
jgi:hypothetical protein